MAIGYDPALVMLPVAVPILAAYTALQLGDRVGTDASGTVHDMRLGRRLAEEASGRRGIPPCHRD